MICENYNILCIMSSFFDTLTSLHYILLFIAGLMLKFVDDLIDNENHIYADFMVVKFFSMICLVLLYMYLFMVELDMIPLALLTTLHGIYADSVYDCQNIDSLFWVLCACIVLGFSLYYFMYCHDDFIGTYINGASFSFIILFSILAIIEMMLFQEEVSIEKITFRSLVVFFFTLFLIISKLTKCYLFHKMYYKVVIILIGYALMSVLNMTLFQKTNETIKSELT